MILTAEMGSLICLDLATGKLDWQKDLFSEDSPEIPPEISKKLQRGCGGDSKQSTPTPTSNGRLIFSINAMGLCTCYDLNGNRQWIKLIETAADEEHFSSSPILAGERIYLFWGCLLALNASDGRLIWKAPDALPTYGTPAITTIGGEQVLVTPAGDVVRGSDGEILCSGLFESRYTTPLIDGNNLYVVDAKAKAWELPAKAEPGMQPRELWKAALGGKFMASPVLHDGLLYTLENQKGRLTVIDARTGELLTGVRGEPLAGLAPAQYAYAAPTAADGRLYFFDDAGNTQLLAAGRTFRPLHTNKLPDALIGTPYFIDNKIIFRGSKTVYCIGTNP